MPTPPDTAWPLVVVAEDPHGGDDWYGLARAGDRVDGAERAGPLPHGPVPPDPPDPPDLRWAASAVLRGELEPDHPLVRRALAPRGVLPDGWRALYEPDPGPPALLGLHAHEWLHRPKPAPVLPTDAWFADIAEDLVPDVGLWAPERVLGPEADEPLPRERRILAGGVMAFSPCMGGDARPIDRWFRDRRHTPVDERLAGHAVDRGVPLLWEVDEEGGWRTPLPCPDLRLPPGTTRLLPRLPGEPGRPVTPGAWVARLFVGPRHQVHAALAMPLRRRVDPVRLVRLLGVVFAVQRCASPRLTWTGFLRTRAEVLYRLCRAPTGWDREPDRTHAGDLP